MVNTSQVLANASNAKRVPLIPSPKWKNLAIAKLVPLRKLLAKVVIILDLSLDIGGRIIKRALSFSVCILQLA